MRERHTQIHSKKKINKKNQRDNSEEPFRISVIFTVRSLFLSLSLSLSTFSSRIQKCPVATRKRKALTFRSFFVAGTRAFFFLFVRLFLNLLNQGFDFDFFVCLICDRPFSDEELRSNAPQVVSCNEYSREVSVSQNIAGKHIDRIFTFDKVLLHSLSISLYIYHMGCGFLILSFQLVRVCVCVYIYIYIYMIWDVDF